MDSLLSLRGSTPASAVGSAISGSSGQPIVSFKEKLITALDIPLELADHTDKSLGYAWQKYKACTAAIKTFQGLWDSGKLQGIFDRKPTQADIISIFKGKTQWHLTYSKTFPKVSNYPQMVDWLEDKEDKLSDL